MTRQRRTPTPILGVYVCTLTNLSDVFQLDKVVSSAETIVKGRRNRATFQMLKNYIWRSQSSRPVGFTHEKKKKKKGGREGGERERNIIAENWTDCKQRGGGGDEEGGTELKQTDQIRLNIYKIWLVG